MKVPARMPALAVLLALAPAAASCSGGGGRGAEGGRPERLLVVATTSILGDVVEHVAGGGADVEVLIPNGIDPHGFEPSGRDVRRLAEADLVVANGLGLEESLAGVLDGTAGNGAAVLEVAPRVDPIEFHDPSGEDLDPHFWTDPVRVAAAAGVVAAALEDVDGSVDWRARASRYAERVRAVHEEIEGILAAVPPARRKLVTNHEVFGYFAARYGFEVLGVVISGGSTLAEPSAADLAALARLLRDERVPAVFAETTGPTRLAEALGAEVGSEVKVVELFTESLGEPGSGADTYLGMMIEDARRIAGALGP